MSLSMLEGLPQRAAALLPLSAVISAFNRLTLGKSMKHSLDTRYSHRLTIDVVALLNCMILYAPPRYPVAPNKPIIKNFSLTIVPGEIIAIVGTDGSGKSTLAQLLLRFYVAQCK